MGHKPFVQDKGQNHRPARFAQRVKEELMTMVPGDLKDPRLAGLAFFTVTSVDLSNDYKHATVHFALMGENKRSKEVEEGLNAAAGYLRRELMHRLDTKITPNLTFKFDKGFENTMEIDALLKKIKTDEGPKED